jgi:hypothetical protein
LRSAGWEAVEQAFEQVACADGVGIERVEGGGLDADRAPVRAELVGDDLGEAGVDALAVLDLRDGDGDVAVGADLEPRAERGFAGVGDEVWGVGSFSPTGRRWRGASDEGEWVSGTAPGVSLPLSLPSPSGSSLPLPGGAREFKLALCK